MAKVYLVQHGVAVDKEQDPERPLSAEGRAEVERVAACLAGRGVSVVEVRHSGKLRAGQTAEVLGTALGARAVREVAGLAPKDDPADIAAALEDGTVYVGHLPHLQRLAGLLVAGDPDRAPLTFSNAGVVCLDLTDGTAAVRWYVTPELC